MPFIPKPKLWRWTNHAKFKMRFYGLSEARVRRIINSPKRKEEGIAPKTIAMMQVAGSTKHPYELWAMVQDNPKTRTVISAWRYPGTTKPGSEIARGILKTEHREYSSKSDFENNDNNK